MSLILCAKQEYIKQFFKPTEFSQNELGQLTTLPKAVEDTTHM